MSLRWKLLPFAARTHAEFSQGLFDWLGRVFYEELPSRGYEVREEQIYTSLRIARALVDGKRLFAEAGSGTGKTFAYLLPVICYARFTGTPAVVSTATGALQAQLAGPQGDVQTLSRQLALNVDSRVATDPGEYLCRVKGDRFLPYRGMKGSRALYNWLRRTQTGARSEVPDVSDELWAQVAWDPSLPCDTCRYRGYACHMTTARRFSHEAGDLVVTNHGLFARDLLQRAEQMAERRVPLLPPYSAVVLDEGHHLPELWQRMQGAAFSHRTLVRTLDGIARYAGRQGGLGSLAEARWQNRIRLGRVLAPRAVEAGLQFWTALIDSTLPAEGKRHVARSEAVLAAAAMLTDAVEALQDDLATEEQLQEGTESEGLLRTYQARLDESLRALALLQSEQALPWVEGDELWVVPKAPASLVESGHGMTRLPLLFSSATLEPGYMARALGLPDHDHSRVGVPFHLAEQVLIYQPATAGDELEQVLALLDALQGRTLVLLNSMAEVARYRSSLRAPWPLLFEGDADRGAMLNEFRRNRSAVLVGASFWEGVDVPGESLSCVIIPHLPFPAHDPLIQERRAQAAARQEEPFQAVDLPAMQLRLKQGIGRLIRTASDRGVLALLDRSYEAEPWADLVRQLLPEGAAQTDQLERVSAFCPLRYSASMPH